MKRQIKKRKKKTVSETIKEKPIRKYENLFGNQLALKYTHEAIEKLADEMLKWYEVKHINHIWLKDFAISKRIGSQRISEFRRKSAYFNKIYEICHDIQESKLIKLGFSKEINVAMPIIVLKNNHGYTDRKEIKQSVTNPNDVRGRIDGMNKEEREVYKQELIAKLTRKKGGR